MSFVTRRALSTLIPPKVSEPLRSLLPRFGRLTEFDSPQAIGAAPDAIRMQRVVSFYEKLPRGAAPEVKAKGLLGRYQAKHFGKNPTAKPIIHLIVFLVSIGYVQNYYFHLRHHKNNAH
ncbi:f-type h+-transporting atpase subunit f [Fusarium flagelliforme]|uniref:F-type h+-transporting atpase subunit f n=1 Tax=Fusarium flagelliforme TaxID=2675880 RepID=A0A395MQE5_9HYPO|nr:f-type h+-transporting atpase subunit f [Fusarium flagelliforme]